MGSRLSTAASPLIASKALSMQAVILCSSNGSLRLSLFTMYFIFPVPFMTLALYLDYSPWGTCRQMKKMCKKNIVNLRPK
jgi:hypothetical protein